MTCPRCGNEWDVTKTPCSRCGLTVRLPNSMRSPTRTPSSTQNQQPPSIKRPVPGEPANTSPVTLSSNQQEFLGPGALPLTSVEKASMELQSRGMMPTLGIFSSQDISTPVPPTTGWMEDKQPQSGSLNPSQSEPLPSWPSARGSEPQKNVPSRPQSMSQMAQTRNIVSEVAQPGLRARRLVTNADKEEVQTVSAGRPASRAGGHVSSNGMTSGLQTPLLLPGTVLRNNRYQLREMLNRQEWQEGVYEATWLALDALRGGAQVSITELVLPENSSMSTQSTLRTATMVLTSVGRNPHVPTLWDAFSDQDRSFFVFEPIEGESLSMRLRRTGRALSEQEVIECALQALDVLELLSQQLPPLVHGLIRPEHIIIGRNRNQYDLVNFSIILAGGATQFVSNLDRTRLSPYMSPEFVRGVVDPRADLYSLVATLYHAVTGSVPSVASSLGLVPSAQRLNPLVSAQLDTILDRGLRPTATQRYQRPAELRQDLLAIRRLSGSPLEKRASTPTGELSFAQLVQSQSSNADTVAQRLPSLLSSELDNEEQERKLLLPRPEDLPVMVERNDMKLSVYWVVGILLFITILVFLTTR